MHPESVSDCSESDCGYPPRWAVNLITEAKERNSPVRLNNELLDPGLKWQRISGPTSPLGRDLKKLASRECVIDLTKAILDKPVVDNSVKLEESEWVACGIKTLYSNDYIKVDEWYFQPSSDSRTGDKLKLLEADDLKILPYQIPIPTDEVRMDSA